MNRQRRTALDDIHTMLLDITLKLEEIEQAVNDVQEEEADARDNMPENLQESERYQQLDETAGALEDISYNISNARDELEEELGRLWDIVGGGTGWN